jgi:hypothetical protein
VQYVVYAHVLPTTAGWQWECEITININSELIGLNEIWNLLPLTALYAETHYRFPLFPFSLYYRRQPEIIFDAPHRIQPGAPLPVTLIVKDADKFPIELEGIKFEFHGQIGFHHDLTFPLTEKIDSRLWHTVFFSDTTDIPPGDTLLDCSLTFKSRGKRRRINNDNHVGLSHRPLGFFRAEHPLPLLPGWSAGELHCHTTFGPDYVEFGAPLEAIQKSAEAIGLGWAALTDHSYNLDDMPGDYLTSDPNLTKWNQLWEEAERLSLNGTVTLLPGEELTCRNSRGRNVHLLLLGNREFLHGTGDGAEKWLRTRSEYSIREALEKISDDAFAAAAHPLVPTPPLERLLVGRGEWSEEDLSHPRLDGWQILNGDWGVDFERGMNAWRKALAGGKPVRILGGNDAHGNFNRFRQVRLPMVRLWEHRRNIFGRFRTLVSCKDRQSETILQALKSAPSAVSDGPFVELKTSEGTGLVRWLTTPEFGSPTDLKVIEVHYDGSTCDLPITTAAGRFSGEATFPLKPVTTYLRAEITTGTNAGQVHRCFTNPVRQSLDFPHRTD